jgi:hypothetical protein
MACVITFNNKKYNYEEFASMLVAGELDKMISDGLIDKSKLSGDMSVLSKGEEQAMPESEGRGISSSRTYNGKYIADQAVDMGSDQGGISDYTAKRIAKEDYTIQNVSIDELRKSDPDLDEYLKSGEIREFEGEPFQMEPIVLSTGEVVDGYNRIAQSIADGKTEIEVYKGVPKGSGVSFSRSTTGSTANPLRGTLDRLSGNLDEKVREEIEANPGAYIDPLKINEAKAKFDSMTDQELMDYMSNTGISILSRDPASNIGLMAKIEAIKRAQNAPDKKFEGVDLSTLLVDAAQLGSVGGRILRMMRELGTINPSTYADLVIKMIEGTGAVLSEDNKASIKLLSKDVVDAGSATLLANSEFEKNPSRANQIALEEARKLENETMDALTKYIEPKMPVSLSKSFISNMQGNLLQIESLGVNLTSTTVGGLFLFLPKAVAKTGISLVRYGVGKAFKTSGNNIAELGYLTALNYYVRAYSPAFSKAWNIMKNGTNSEINVARGEVRSSLKPTTLLNVLFNSEEYARRVKGSEDFEYRMFNGKYEVFSQNAPNKVLHTFSTEAAAKKMAFELSNPLDWTNTNKYIIKTITGLAPEAMFRIMSATDTLIREPNTAYINAMFGTRLGLKGDDLASFVFEPSKEYKEHLKYQAAKSVFQEDRKATTIVTNAIKELENMSNSNMLASGLNVMVRTSMPYVKTPANIVAQYIDYAFPFWPMYKAITNFAKANTEKSEAKKKVLLDSAEESMSVAITGFGMWAAFSMLSLGGLMTAGYDHYDDDEKDLMARIGIPFSSVNISAVKRLMDGGSMENQPNDEYVALKYFGLFGMVGQMHSNRIQKERADYMKNSKVFNGSNEQTMTAKFFEMFSVFDVMGTAFDQSFAAGINTIFGVMRDPESKGTYAVRGYAQSLVAGFGVPATASKYFEAEYIPNLTDKNSAVKTFTNVFMYRIAGITDGVPAKIDVFGRKLAPYAPEGKDPKIYNTFYPFKVKKSTGDPIDFMLYETMVKSKNPAVIPSKYKQQDIMDVLPDLQVSGFRPTPADVEALNIDRGQRRLQKLTEMMNGEYFAYVDNGELVEVETFDKLPVNSRVEYIKAAYKDADAEHISEFRNEYVRKIAQGLGAKFIEQEEQEETEE